MHRQKKFRAVTPGVAWLLASLQIDSIYGREALKNLRPAKSDELEKLERHFEELTRLVAAAASSDFFTAAAGPYKCLRYIGGSLDNLEAGQVPDETDLLEIKGFAMMLNQLKSWYDASELNLPSVVFDDLHGVVELLNPDHTIVASFHIHEAYSGRLKDIRAAKRLLEAEILKCQDQPRREQLRNERQQIVLQEREEEAHVRGMLGTSLKPWFERLRRNGCVAGRLELLLAMARVAVEHGCCRPELSSISGGGSLVAEDMVNPEVDELLRRHDQRYTPISIEVQPGATLLTGANMGGKTVALLTLAMNAELAALGFFVFARRFAMPLFDFICLISGDGQSQVSGLSSFGAEMIRLSELVAMTRQGVGLAVCDEFARSTNPYEGSRFVQALGEFMQSSGSYGVIATHYDGIKIDGAAYWQVIGLKSKEYRSAGSDRASIVRNLCSNMDYRLKKLSGEYSVPRDAWHIATILDVDPEFMALLRSYYPPEEQ